MVAVLSRQYFIIYSAIFKPDETDNLLIWMRREAFQKQFITQCHKWIWYGFVDITVAQKSSNVLHNMS